MDAVPRASIKASNSLSVYAVTVSMRATRLIAKLSYA